jgi:ferric-dicitrate binding protein FerR (iron transport regulator)
MRSMFIALFALALAGTLSAGPVGVITSVTGKVSLYSAGSAKAQEIKLGASLQAGDRLKTGANGRAAIVLIDGTQLKINYNTDITLRDKDSTGKASARGVASIKLALGDLWAKVTKKDSRLEFDTPAAVAAVKGTEPLLSVDELGNLCAQLREGHLDISNSLGSVQMSRLEQLCITRGQKPGTPTAYDPTKQQGFDTTFTAPTSAEVTLVTSDGKKILVEYGK